MVDANLRWEKGLGPVCAAEGHPERCDLKPTLEAGFIHMAIRDKPTSRMQRCLAECQQVSCGN